MRKQIFAIAAAAALSLTLTACGGESAATPSSSVQPTEQTALSPHLTSYVFQVKDASISIDQNMTEVLDVLGEANSYFEAASCAFKGLDKTYTYSGFVITTRPDGDKDYVNSILLTDDSVTTAEGIYIGSSQDDVLAAYGQANVENDVIQYTLGNTTLNFILKDGAVISIEYIPA